MPCPQNGTGVLEGLKEPPSTLLVPQSRFGDKPLKFQVVGPQRRDRGPTRGKDGATQRIDPFSGPQTFSCVLTNASCRYIGAVDEAEEAPPERREGGGEAEPRAVARRARGGAHLGQGQGEGQLVVVTGTTVW